MMPMPAPITTATYCRECAKRLTSLSAETHYVRCRGRNPYNRAWETKNIPMPFCDAACFKKYQRSADED
jgi:hypothetical protein